MPLSLRLALLMAAGSAAGVHLSVGSWRLLAGIAVTSALASALARVRGVGGAAMALLAVSVFAAASCRAALVVKDAERPPLVEWFERQTLGTAEGEARFREAPTRVRGRVLRDAVPTEYGAQVPLAVTHVETEDGWVNIRGGLSVSVSGELLHGLNAWRAGRTIEAPMGIRRPARYRNAGLTDQVRSLAWRGTPLVASVKSGVLVEAVAPGAWWDERAAEVRAGVRRAMQRHVAPLAPVSAAIGTAILIGDRAHLSPDVERRLQEAGTYHVVAISGGNIAILAGALLAILWSLRIRFAPAAGITALALIVHAWVVGGGSSVVRATGMAAVYLALRLIDQRTAPVHALGVASAGILALNPLEIAGAGFWLTFGATGALLMAASRWPRPPRPRWWEPVVAIPLASCAVEILLVPVSAYVFERVTLAGLVLNLAAVPAMGLVQGAASACVLADALGLDLVARATGHATHLAASALVGSSGLVTMMPWATWRVPPPSMVLLGTYYATVAGWWRVSAPPIDSLVRRRAGRLAGTGALILWVWIALAPLSWLPPAPGGPLRITAIDVGQGDAFLVTAPDGQTLMVDAGGVSGGAFDIGDRVVGPALRARGLRRLDYVAVTHGDLDHLGGAAALLRDFRPREMWGGVPVTGHPPLDALRGASRSFRTPWRWLQRGDRLELGGMEVRVHHPALPDWERQRVRNDDSLVLEVRVGAVSVWLTGDITRPVEDELVASAEAGRLVVVKAAHHGSLTSSGHAWVRHLRPAVVLVSAGRGNLFGHPAASVLRRYTDAGAEVFRTDLDGQIEVVTNGHYVEVSTFTGRRWRLR